MGLLHRAQEIFGKKVFKEQVRHEKGAWGIIEWNESRVTSGSNDYSTGYAKYENGLMIQWGGLESGTLSSTSDNNIGTYGWSFYFVAVTVTFPKRFTQNPIVVASGAGVIATVWAITTGDFSVRPYGFATSSRPIYWTAIGRWK